MIVAPELASAKPYLMRAIYEWCCDQGQTPYATIFVDELVQVPMAYVKDGSITLNIGPEATNSLIITSETLEFNGRFGGVAKLVIVPVTHVMAIYGRESGEGMAFPISDPAQLVQPTATAAQEPMRMPTKLAATPIMVKEKTKPVLTRIK